MQDRDEHPESYSIDPVEEGDLSDLGELTSGSEPIARPAEPRSGPVPASRPAHARARIAGVEAGVAAGLVPSGSTPSDPDSRLGAPEALARSDDPDGGDADEASDTRATDSVAGPGSFSATAASTSPALPDWRDPPTREVPRVLLEHPLADPVPAYPGPVWREVESDWNHDDLTFAEIVSQGTSVADHGLSPDEPDPFAFDFEIGPGAGGIRAGGAPSGRAVESAWDPLLDDIDYGDHIGNGDGSDGADEPVDPSTGSSGSVALEAGGGSAGLIDAGGSALTEQATAVPPTVEAPTGEASGPPHRARVTFAGRVRRGDRPAAGTSDAPHKPGRWMRLGRRTAEAPLPARAPAHAAHAPAPPVSATARRNPVVATLTGLATGFFVLLCFFSGPPIVLALVTVVLVVATAECYQALRLARYQPAVLLGLLAVPALTIAGYLKGPQAFPIVGAVYVFATMCWYLIGVTRRSPIANIGASLFSWLWVGMLGGFAVLLLDPTAFPHRHGLAYLLGAIEATVAYDVGGYAFGSWIGKRPLAPRISPNKTWEGLLGGCFTAIAISVAVTSQMAPWTVAHAFELGVVVSVFAPLGDLAESMIKRDLRVKDMGTLLPAHGGLLDRVDGLLFALPAAYILVRLFHS